MIVRSSVTDPPVSWRAVRNEPVSIGHHPFFVFSEAPERLRALTQFLDVFQRRGLARKMSKLIRLGAIVLGIPHWLNFHLERKRGESCHRSPQ
jgi:hypothetical protein